MGVGHGFLGGEAGKGRGRKGKRRGGKGWECWPRDITGWNCWLGTGKGKGVGQRVWQSGRRGREGKSEKEWREVLTRKEGYERVEGLARDWMGSGRMTGHDGGVGKEWEGVILMVQEGHGSLRRAEMER